MTKNKIKVRILFRGDGFMAELIVEPKSFRPEYRDYRIIRSKCGRGFLAHWTMTRYALFPKTL